MSNSVRRTSDATMFNPLEDPHFSDTIQDFLTIFATSELESKPYLQNYLVELLARWGRWLSRGRAPALCFEAACVGGLSFLKRTGREPCELTARADAALARLLAGMVIDEVEPMARRQGGPAREKAIAIVADEFLAKTASSNPSVANSAKKRMKKRRTVIKMADSEDLLASKGIGFEPPPRRPSLSSESSNYSPRPIVGVDRRPSLGDGSQNPNAGYPMQQRPDNDYYTRQNPPTTNNDPNSYYAAGPSYGRGRKISNDSSYSDSFNPNQQQPQPRYPGGNQRTRQASVPLYNSANAEVQQPYFDQQQQARVRQASEGGYDNNRPAQYFSDSRFIAGQKGRKSSLEGLPSSLNSAGSSSGGSASEYPERIVPSGRPRKTSADSNSRSNYSQNYQQQQFYQNQPINPSYGDGASAYYNPDYVVRPRKNSLTELDYAAQFRARAGSVDRNLNASRYDADNRTVGNMYPRQQSIPSPPIGIGASRRPSQLAKAGLYQQPSFQRSRYPSNSGEDPFDRQINQQQQQQQMRSSPPKPNIAGSRAGNLSHYSRQPIAEQSGETEYGFRGPQQYRGESGRRPSQESPEKRRPSYEDNNSGGYMRGTSSGGPYRQSPDDRPIRSRTPTPLDYRGGKAPQQNNTAPPDQYYNSAVPGRSKTPTKKVDDLGNYLQNVFFDKPRE